MDPTAGTQTDQTDRSAAPFLDLPIKEVIARFPQVGAILSEYEVGCVECGLGSCLLRDIVGIHDVSPEDEEALMARISGVLFPGQDLRLTLPRRTRPEEATAEPTATAGTAATGSTATESKGGTKYSPPVRQLVGEHVLIMRLVNLIPRLLAVLNLENPADRELVLQGVDFIRSYADRFHHAKEEDILFKYFDETKDIIRVMLTDHDTARAHVRAVEAAVSAGDRAKVAEHLEAYAALLTEHIKKEDTILYPWMDRQLSTAQVGEMFRRFAETEAATGPDFAERYTQSLERIEEIVRKREESEGGV